MSDTARSVRFCRAAALLLCLCLSAPAAAGVLACNDFGTVVAAIFTDPSSGCDLNADGVVSAADLTYASLSPTTPTASASASPTATPTPNLDGSPTATATSELTATPSITNTSTLTPTATRTPTPGICPTAGAGLIIEIDNQTGTAPLSVVLTGERIEEACQTTALSTSYSVTTECSGSGVVVCATASDLAPGEWRHSLHVQTPRTGQLQHQVSMVVANDTANRVRFTAFASVVSVETTANTGNGSLRNLLQTADSSAKPLLIQFDPAVFPDGVPTTIHLQFQLPILATDDVTIDGIDATGAAGNRIIDADGLAIPVLPISGARNHIIGLRLQNAGGSNRDVLNISGAAADANVVERVIVENAATGDGIGVDADAGKDFDASVNIIRDCEVSGASDKGIKVTTGAHARVENCWVHDNVNGGIQSTLGGHVQAWQNLVERNHGGTAQNGLSVNARDDNPTSGHYSEMRSWGNIARGNGANGFSVRAFAFADVRDDYLATNGTSGIRVFNDVGPAAAAVVEGTSAVCNAVDGAVVANTSMADFGGGQFASAGNNAFTQNNLPAGGANFRNATGMLVSTLNNQWEHCGHETTCNDNAIASFDLSDHGANTEFSPAQAHRSLQAPVITAVAPAIGKQGELLRIFGSGFNVIDGHFAEDNCADVTGRNRCVPLRGNCVQINGVSAPVEAVTPTMLVVRWPFTCTEPVRLVVTTDQGSTGASSAAFTVCTNDAVDAVAALNAAELRPILP
jgi:hypothetical protein